MKRKIKLTFLALLFACSQAFSQSPNMINYQGVAMNSTGTAIINQTISIRATVHQATANGTILFSEERSVLTDATGLFDFQIGSPGATATTGSWNAISWDNGNKFLEIEMDPSGGTNFIAMGTQQLVSVPYAQYANKAGALIPTATINPNQLNAGGAAINQVLKYNGTNWVPGVDVSAFALPYSATDANTNSFYITNNSASIGNAIYGNSISNATIARGVLGNASGTNGVGVYGSASGSNGNGVEGYSNNATGNAIKATHAANGIALEATSGTGIAVSGECTGGLGTAIKGLSNGTSASSIGVYGESANGTGVKGYGNNAGSVAVFGSSLAGTGVKAYSFTGKALDVIGTTNMDGNLKISGGTTNPSLGAVLTSDATGNATWKPKRIAFGAIQTTPSTTLPEGVVTSLAYQSEEFDLGANLNPSTAATDPNTFIVPVDGVYHFSGRVKVDLLSLSTNLESVSLSIYKNGVLKYSTTSGGPSNNSTQSSIGIGIDQTMELNAGDKIKLVVAQYNLASIAAIYRFATFSGHLVFAD